MTEVLIANPAKYGKLVEALIQGGVENLQFISDFDNTITAMGSPQSWSVVESFPDFSQVWIVEPFFSTVHRLIWMKARRTLTFTMTRRYPQRSLLKRRLVHFVLELKRYRLSLWKSGGPLPTLLF